MPNLTVDLHELISTLQSQITQGVVTSRDITSATNRLACLGFQYDANLFPELKHGSVVRSNVGASPTSLAEALLWKMGKWNVYKEFVSNYDDPSRHDKKSDVVFFAFAKHLKDHANPIYDQHALRAMWAINGSFTDEEKQNCKAALFISKGERKGKWKSALSGSKTKDCYDLYVRQVKAITKGGLSHTQLDKLLMPLGQALKKNAASYEKFRELCGW